METHTRGQRHQRNLLTQRYYGHCNALPVCALGFEDVCIDHDDVPDALAAYAQSTWEHLSADTAAIVALAGSSNYARVMELLRPERVICAALRLSWELKAEAHQALRSCLLSIQTPAALAALPAVLGRASDASRGAPISLLICPMAGSDLATADTVADVAALTVGFSLFAESLRDRCFAPTITLRVDEDDAIGQRLLRASSRPLARVLARPSGLLHVRGIRFVQRRSSPPRFLAEEVVHVLQKVEAGSWRARAMAVLLGTHVRVGASSPIRLLPAAVVDLILHHAAVRGRTEISVERSGALEDGHRPARSQMHFVNSLESHAEELEGNLVATVVPPSPSAGTMMDLMWVQAQV